MKRQAAQLPVIWRTERCPRDDEVERKTSIRRDGHPFVMRQRSYFGHRGVGKNPVLGDQFLVVRAEVLVMARQVEVKRSCEEVFAALQRFVRESVQALEFVDGCVVQVPQVVFGKDRGFGLPQCLLFESVADQRCTSRVAGNRVQC
jgi:hypothetical protein